jgi:hypothetical protein
MLTTEATHTALNSYLGCANEKTTIRLTIIVNTALFIGAEGKPGMKKKIGRGKVGMKLTGRHKFPT